MSDEHDNGLDEVDKSAVRESADKPATRPLTVGASAVLQILAIVVVFAVLGALAAFISSSGRSGRSDSLCMANLKDISTAAWAYSDDHAGTFPLSSQWNFSLKSYLRRTEALMCPADDSGKPSYAMNDALSDLHKSTISSPVNCAAFFESVPGDNMHGGANLFPPKPRHGELHLAVSVTGAAMRVKPSGLGKVSWNPCIQRRYG